MSRQRKGRKRTSKVAAKRALATTRSTAGTGYDFEDQVAAWLLLGMMRGAPAPMLDTSVAEIAWQTRKPVDDLELRAPPGSGLVAVSCKSSVQVSARGLPADFVEAAWRHRRESKQANSASKVMLAARDSHRDFNAAWKDIKDWCREGPSGALDRINASRKHNTIFSGIAAEVRRQESIATDDSIIAFLNDIDVVPLDFQLAQSKDEADAIVACRTLLKGEELEQAQELWRALLAEAKDKRLAGGTLDLTQLIATLRSRFALKDHPDFAPSVAALQELSDEQTGRIELALPSGFTIARGDETNRLRTSLARSPLTLVYGDSGAGKSALVLSSLRVSGDRTVIWLRASDFERLSNAADRAGLGVQFALHTLLPAIASPLNVLVIDSAERLSPEGVKALAALVQSLTERSSDSNVWRVVVIAQSAGLDDLEALRPRMTSNDDFVEIGAVSAANVREALRAVPQLAWMASEDDAVEALRNLKTLAWVTLAQDAFRKEVSGGVVSRISIADRLWRHWTEGRLVLQRILMAMAEREAEFAGALPLSMLGAAELAEIERLPVACPVVISSSRRLEFRHDLASDWSRYQRLREVSDNPSKWAAFAGNPFWHPALRMLGQQLLREQVHGRCAWDLALETLENSKGTERSGADLLLDALCLDPLADRWLNERSELLLDQHGKRLARMLERFHHIATLPTLAAATQEKGIGFFIEAMFRRPIYGRWGPVVRFVHGHLSRIAPLGLASVSKLCETWLKGTPVTLASGAQTYYRKELAELAIASARELQLQLLQNWIIHGKEPEQVYAAAFAAAPDLPDDVAAWALEMARRRPARDDILARKKSYDQEQARQHAERMKSDAEYRKRHARKASGSGMFLGPRKLPPWPDGAKGRIDTEFQRSCCHRGVLSTLMPVRPEVAAEILLAVIIDDQPEEEREDGIHYSFGLAYDHDGNPPVYWQSPFYAFLHAEPQQGLKALLKLVEFCTERWRALAEGRSKNPAPGIEVEIAPGEQKRFWGSRSVYSWSYERHGHSVQLPSALAALERWLWERCEAGQAIDETVATILRDSSSVAVLGVLVNVGKAHPRLFEGALASLLQVVEIYFWDKEERDGLPFRFDAFGWSRTGDQIFAMARQWILAPFRNIDLGSIALERQRTDDALASAMRASLQKGQAAHSELDADARQFIATLDNTNYARQGDGTFQFKCPSGLVVEEPPTQPSERDRLLAFEAIARHVLRQQGHLADQGVADGVKMLDELDSTSLLNTEEKRGGQTALASVLLIKADKQLKTDAALRQRCIDLVRQGIVEPDKEHPYGRRMRFQVDPAWDFAGTAIIACWLRQPDDPVWCQLLLEFMTGLTEGAVGAVIASTFPHRVRLGDRWFRLLELSTYWAALLALKPRDDEGGSEKLWQLWRSRLRRQPIELASSLDRALGLAGLARRVERMFRSRHLRSEKSRRYWRDGEAPHHLSWGLDTRVLSECFDWALSGPDNADEPSSELRRDVALALWEFETWRLFEEVDRKDRLPCDVGYAALRSLGRAATELPTMDAKRCWQAVLKLGAPAEAAISHFMNAFFSHFKSHADPARLFQVWREMITFALEEGKRAERSRWYERQKMLHCVLGFHAESLIRQLPEAPKFVGELSDLYQRWGEANLTGDEDNRTYYAYFLTTSTASHLLESGTRQIAHALTSDPDHYFGRRDRAGESLVELVEHIISNDLARGNGALRTAVLSIADVLAQHRVPNSMALQDRIRRMKQ